MSDRLTIAQQIELMALLFLHGMALASWFVPLSSVLQQAGLDSIKSLAYSASAVAAMLSPLFFGAMADRAVAPAKVLRWISLATAALVGIIGWSVSHDLPAWAILLLIQVQSLLCSPTSSLSGSIVFARLANSQRQFGMIRALGTIGWMVGLWITSGLSLDDRPEAFYLSGFLWLVLGCYTLCLPHELVNTGPPRRLSLRERFGLDALQLLRVHDHRAVFVTAALIAIPFAAFYPQTPKLLNHLGFEKVSAWMSLGQVAEVFALISITSLLHRWRLKWMVLAGIGCGVARYLLYASELAIPVLIGLALHGLAFTFTYVSAQIYLAQKIEAAWRTRAQALLSFASGGVGNLSGYLLTEAWLKRCSTENTVQWGPYWLGLAALVFAVLLYFSFSYQGNQGDSPTDQQSGVKA